MNKTILHVSLLKTLYFNLYYFPLRLAIKLPVLVGRKMKLRNMGSHNSVCLNSEQFKPGMVHLGLPYGSFDKFSGGGTGVLATKEKLLSVTVIDLKLITKLLWLAMEI